MYVVIEWMIFIYLLFYFLIFFPFYSPKSWYIQYFGSIRRKNKCTKQLKTLHLDQRQNQEQRRSINSSKSTLKILLCQLKVHSHAQLTHIMKLFNSIKYSCQPSLYDILNHLFLCSINVDLTFDCFFILLHFFFN